MTRRKEEWNGADVVGLGHVVPYGLSYPSLPLPLRSITRPKVEWVNGVKEVTRVRRA